MEVFPEQHDLFTLYTREHLTNFSPRCSRRTLSPAEYLATGWPKLDLNPDNPSATAFNDDIHLLPACDRKW